jgi:hypothetical protein
MMQSRKRHNVASVKGFALFKGKLRNLPVPDLALTFLFFCREVYKSPLDDSTPLNKFLT